MKTSLSIVTAAALLAACGGGGGGGTPPAPATVSGSDVPLSATQDASAAYQFVASVAASSSDSADPIVVGDATLATSETQEPAAQ